MHELLTIAVAVLLFVENPASSADFQKGMVAVKRGDFATALREFRPLSEQEDAYAQFNLAVMYYAGKGGVIQDNIYAHMWWNLAASQGDENARKYRDIIDKKMFPSQIEKAQDLARECVKKNYKGR